MALYENVKRIADERGISIYELEHNEKVHIGNGTIGAWKGLDNPNPSLSTLTKIADYLHCSVEDLIKES